MRLKQTQWEKLFYRWSDFPDCGEKRLVCAVLAAAIVEEPKEAQRDGRVEFNGGFWARGFVSYCKAIHLSPAFVMEQIMTARAFNDEMWRFFGGEESMREAA